MAATVDTIDWLPALSSTVAETVTWWPYSPAKSAIQLPPLASYEAVTTLPSPSVKVTTTPVEESTSASTPDKVKVTNSVPDSRLISPTVTERSSSSSAVVSKSKPVDAEAVFPASSVTLTDTATYPSASVPPDTSAIQSPLLPASAFAVTCPPSAPVSVTVTIAASLSTPVNVRVTLSDSGSLITVSTETASTVSSPSAVVSSSKLADTDELPVRSSTATCPSPSAVRSPGSSLTT